MRETEARRSRAGNEPAGRDELGRVHDEEHTRRGANEWAIPDYVMWDFGLPEETPAKRLSRRRNASSMVGTFEEAWLEPFLLLHLQDGGSYGPRLEEKLGELGFDGMRSGEMCRTLWKMERKGLINCDRAGGGFRIPRRWYELTEAGEAHLELWVDSLARCREDVDLFFRLYDGCPERKSHG